MDKRVLQGTTERIAKAAPLLALTAALQIVGRHLTACTGPADIFIVATLVNACLPVAVDWAGIGGGTVIALAAPPVTLLTGTSSPCPSYPSSGLEISCLCRSSFS